MTLDHLLADFYRENGLPEGGGVDKNTFRMQLFGLSLTLPNPEFRKEATHIHDLQHVLHGCDTSWKGEGFISGWEIATGMWKYFPLALFSLWAMGYSFWFYPRTVFQGFKKGLSQRGIIDLRISKAEFLGMTLDELKALIDKPNAIRMGFWQWLQFFAWVLLSQLVVLFPLVMLTLVLLWMI